MLLTLLSVLLQEPVSEAVVVVVVVVLLETASDFADCAVLLLEAADDMAELVFLTSEELAVDLVLSLDVEADFVRTLLLVSLFDAEDFFVAETATFSTLLSSFPVTLEAAILSAAELVLRRVEPVLLTAFADFCSSAFEDFLVVILSFDSY